MPQRSPRLTIRRPRMHQQFPVGADFLVSGTAVGTGGAQPRPITSVTVQVGGQPPVEADLTAGPPTQSPATSFSASVRLNTPGEQRIVVRAIDDIGKSVTSALTVATPGTLLPLTTVFNYTATLTTTYAKAPGPYSLTNLSMLLTFNANRDSVHVASFSPFTTPEFQTPAGKSTTTVSMKSFIEGAFHPDTGDMALRLSLFFDHSLDLWLVTEDSSLNRLLLGTRVAPGVPLQRETRGLTLVGSGRFTEGILGGSQGTLMLAGTLQDLP